MMQNLVFLSKHYDVDCLILDKEKPTKECLNELNKYSKNIIFIKTGNLFSKIFHCLSFFVRGKPLQNGYFYSRKMNKTIKAIYKHYDAIFCMHMRTGQYVLKYGDVKKYIDCPDCITLNSKNEYLHSKGIRRLLFKIDYSNVKKFESRKYKCFDGVYVINKRDKEFLIEMDSRLKDKTHILYNYVRDLGYKKEYDIQTNKSICFLGRVAYGPNTIAIKHFVNDIFPHLRAKYPDLVFNVYGGSVTSEIKNLENPNNGIKVHGFVDDIAKEIQSNSFVVASMISGSGTQNKVLECMKLKKLVVTTTIGADGLDDVDDKSLVICHDDQDFIKQCLFYLDDSNKAAKEAIQENAVKYVDKHFSMENSEEQLISKLF